MSPTDGEQKMSVWNGLTPASAITRCTYSTSSVVWNARHVRAMVQGRQRCDQVDAAVVPDVRGQRGAAPASRARLQPRQFLVDAGDARADQGLVADELEGEANQDRREGGEPRTLCRLPNGRGRHPTANVPGDSAAHRRTATAVTTSHGETLDGHAFNSNQPEECVPMPENGHIISSTNVRAAPRCC